MGGLGAAFDLDRCMPEMDGLEATRRIKGTEKSRHKKIVALTAISFEEDRNKILAAGCDDSVREPFQEVDIFEKRSEQNSVHCLSDGQKATFEGTHYSFEELASQDTECLNGSGHASLIADPDEILYLAGQVQRNDPELGEPLNSPAGDFQFDEILKSIEQLYKQIWRKTSPLFLLTFDITLLEIVWLRR